MLLALFVVLTVSKTYILHSLQIHIKMEQKISGGKKEKRTCIAICTWTPQVLLTISPPHTFSFSLTPSCSHPIPFFLTSRWPSSFLSPSLTYSNLSALQLSNPLISILSSHLLSLHSPSQNQTIQTNQIVTQSVASHQKSTNSMVT